MSDKVFGRLLFIIPMLGLAASIVFFVSLAMYLSSGNLAHDIGHFIKTVKEASK